jgi:hypothetical protein
VGKQVREGERERRRENLQNIFSKNVGDIAAHSHLNQKGC